MTECPHPNTKVLTRPEEFDFSIEDQTFQANKLKQGQLNGSRKTLKIGEICLSITEINLPVLFSGKMPDNCLRIILSTSKNHFHYSSSNGRTAHQFCMMPDKAFYKITTPQTKYFSISIPLHCLERILTKNGYNNLLNIYDRFDKIEYCADQTSKLIQFLNRLFIDPPVSDDDGNINSKTIIEKELVKNICDFIYNKNEKKHDADDRRTTIFFKALKIINQEKQRNITVSELADQVHVSVRTLQYIFQEILQTTPKSFIRNIRMNAIRRKLLGNENSQQKIQTSARSFGFIHMGNFAKYYRELFDESPKQTLDNIQKEKFK